MNACKLIILFIPFIPLGVLLILVKKREKNIAIAKNGFSPREKVASRMRITLSIAPTLYYLLTLCILAVENTEPGLILFAKVVLLQHPISNSFSGTIMLISWAMLPLITAFLVALVNRHLQK